MPERRDGGHERTAVPKIQSGRPFESRSPATTSSKGGTLQPSLGFAAAQCVRFTMCHADSVRSAGSCMHVIHGCGRSDACTASAVRRAGVPPVSGGGSLFLGWQLLQLQQEVRCRLTAPTKLSDSTTACTWSCRCLAVSLLPSSRRSQVQRIK